MSEETKFILKMDDTGYKTPEVSKKGAIKSAHSIYEQIMEGKLSAIQVAEMFKFVETSYEELKKFTDERGKNSFTDLVREEITTSADDGKKITTKNGSVFEIIEAGKSYQYDSTGDPIWEYYNAKIKELSALKKEREEFLKRLSSVVIMSLPHPETGELLENVEIYPPATTSTSTFKQTILKG